MESEKPTSPQFHQDKSAGRIRVFAWNHISLPDYGRKEGKPEGELSRQLLFVSKAKYGIIARRCSWVTERA